MTLRSQLLKLFKLFAASSSLAPTSISTRVFGSGTVISRIEAGGDVVTGTYENALRWFSSNWPADLPWPPEVPRPAQSQPEEAA